MTVVINCHSAQRRCSLFSLGVNTAMKVRAKLKAPRHKFGHQCRFGDSTACVLAEITSDPDLEAFVVKKDVCTVEYDTTPQ